MIMTWNTKWQLTFVMISFKLNWVGRYLVFFQHHRLLFFTTTQRTSQREEEFKSTIGCSVDRPVSLTNCFEQHSKSAILEIVNQKIKGGLFFHVTLTPNRYILHVIVIDCLSPCIPCIPVYTLYTLHTYVYPCIHEYGHSITIIWNSRFIWRKRNMKE